MSEYRKLASIKRVRALEPIKGANRIELAKIDGWQSVVQKGQFKLNDKVIFAEIDSVLPDTSWSAFLKDKRSPNKPIRIKTCRLKGTLSQGVIFPTTILDGADGFEEGHDCTEALGITKYEVPIPANLNGDAKGNFPYNLFPKTDELRIQSYPDVLNELKDVNVYITVKFDGTSFSCYRNGDTFGVCSRNMELLESDNNSYWKVARSLDLENKMKQIPFNLAIQGEMYGPGIQSNRMGVTEVKLAVFNIYNIDERRYLNFTEMVQLLNVHKLGQLVDVAYIGKFQFPDVDSVLKFADEQLYQNKEPAEGIVIRPLNERHSEVLRSRLSIKAISNKFLEKYGE